MKYIIQFTIGFSISTMCGVIFGWSREVTFKGAFLYASGIVLGMLIGKIYFKTK